MIHVWVDETLETLAELAVRFPANTSKPPRKLSMLMGVDYFNAYSGLLASKKKGTTNRHIIKTIGPYGGRVYSLHATKGWRSSRA